MKIIFVAGCPRSGSTWLSRALGVATHYTVMHEPFNSDKFPELASYEMQYLPGDSHDPRFVEVLNAAIRRHTGRRWPLKFLMGRYGFVLKEVHAILAVEYLWQLRRPQTVVLLRHPCAMAASWTRVQFDPRRRLDRMLAQEALMRDHLEPYADHLRQPRDFLGEVGAMWGAVYHVLLRLAQRHPEWQVVRHEDLLRDPVAGVDALLTKMGRKMSPQGRQFLLDNNRNPDDANPYNLARDASKELRKPKEALGAAETQRVMEGAAPFMMMHRYYPDLAPQATGAVQAQA